MSDLENLRPCTKEEMEQWAASSVRGVRGSYTGSVSDAKGNVFRQLQAKDDDGFDLPTQEQSFVYINWHQRNHKAVPDANCKICASEQQFKQQHADLRGKRVASPPCKQCGYGADAHVGPTRECPV